MNILFLSTPPLLKGLFQILLATFWIVFLKLPIQIGLPCLHKNMQTYALY